MGRSEQADGRQRSLLAGGFFRRSRRSVPGSLAMPRRCGLYNPTVVGRIGRGTGELTGPEQVNNRRRSGRNRQTTGGDSEARDRGQLGCKARQDTHLPPVEGGRLSGRMKGRRATTARSRPPRNRRLTTSPRGLWRSSLLLRRPPPTQPRRGGAKSSDADEGTAMVHGLYPFPVPFVSGSRAN